MKKWNKLILMALTALLCVFLGCEKKKEILLTETQVPEEAEASGESRTGEEAETHEENRTGEKAETHGESRTWEEAETHGESRTGEEQKAEETGGQGKAAEEKQTEVCVIHICGAVKKPGVYTLAAGSRLYEAVEAAEGFLPEAAVDFLNQADKLGDGMKIYVPTLEEAAESLEAGKEKDFISGGEDFTAGAIQKTGGNAGEKKEAPLVNINEASEEELCTLSGIGSGKAKGIISYREKQGSFRSIEEIMQVEGIKQGLFAKIKDSITV